jgi:hypothetical protein
MPSGTLKPLIGTPPLPKASVTLGGTRRPSGLGSGVDSRLSVPSISESESRFDAVPYPRPLRLNIS